MDDIIPSHRYMYAGAAHADTGEYRECVRLWNYALSLKIMKVTPGAGG